MKFALIVAVVGLMAGSASAATVSLADIEIVKAKTAAAHSECRDHGTKVSCAYRDKGFEVLKQLNICWNAKSATPAEAWVPCAAPAPAVDPREGRVNGNTMYAPCEGIADSRNYDACIAYHAREGRAKAWQGWAR